MHSPVKVWRNQKKVAALVGKTGTIVSWTVVRVPPGGFSDQAPYPVVIVDLGDKRITAQLVDHPLDSGQARKENFIGMKVVTVVRRIVQPSTEGVIPYGIKVKPL